MEYLAYTVLKLKITVSKFIYYKIAVFAELEFFYNYEMALFKFQQNRMVTTWHHTYILKKACYLKALCDEEACNNGKRYNSRLIKEIIESGNVDNFTLVKYICSYTDLEIVSFLFSKTGKYYNFGLQKACKHNNMKVIDFLIKKGANINDGLLVAAAYNNLGLIKYLISCFSPSSFLRSKNEGEGRKDKNEGEGEIEIVDFNGIFKMACFHNHKSIIRYIWAEYPVDLNEGLFSACRGKNVKLVKKLIKNGATKLNKGLLVASSENDLLTVLFLISKGANNLNEAFGVACYYHSNTVIAYFIPRGVDFNYGLKHACKGGQINIIKFLIECGASDINGCFYEACKHGDLDIVMYLIERGATVFDTGLQGAAESEFFEEVSEKLLELGANPDYGLIGACNKGDYTSMKYFIDHGAQNIFEMMDIHKNNSEIMNNLNCILNKNKCNTLFTHLTKISEN